MTGSIDVVVPNRTGFLNEDLREAAVDALKLDGKACTDYARVFSWQRCAEVFASFLSPAAA